MTAESEPMGAIRLLRGKGAGKRLASGLTVVAALAATACGSSSGPTAATHNLVFGTAIALTDGCDAATIVTTANTLTCPSLVEETLVSFDWSKDTVLPALATSWQVSGNTITFHLRPHVTFQDGTAFDAAAVVFNFRRVWDKSFPANANIQSIYASQVPFQSVQAINNSTVEVTLTQAEPNEIWDFSGYPTQIESPTAINKWGKDYPFHAVGTGPYELTSYISGQDFVVQRYSHYWGTPPAPTKIEVLTAASSETLTTDLQSHTIDAMLDPPVQSISQLSSSGFEVKSYPSLLYYYENLNVTLPPFNDVRVRQAVNYALDKEAVVQASKGGAIAMYGAWFPGSYAYNANVPQYKYDPAMAEQLLNEAGWVVPAGGTVREKDGKSLTISFVNQSTDTGLENALDTVMLSDLEAVGINVKFQTLQHASYITFSLMKTFNMIHFGDDAPFPDPQQLLFRFTTAAFPPAERNLSYYSNSQYDQLISTAAGDLNPTSRAQELEQAQLILRNDAPVVWGVQAAEVSLFSPTDLTAVPVLPNGEVDVNGIAFK